MNSGHEEVERKGKLFASCFINSFVYSFPRRIEGREDWKSGCCAVLDQVQQEISRKYYCKLSVKSLKFSNL